MKLRLLTNLILFNVVKSFFHYTIIREDRTDRLLLILSLYNAVLLYDFHAE